MFKPLWSSEALADIDPPPRTASYDTKLKYRQFRDEIQRRKQFNEQLKAQRDTYWQTSNNRYFQVLTDTMLRTNPAPWLVA